MIGKISTSLDRGFVFDLVPTPLNDAGEAASWIIESKDDNNNKKKGGSKSKTQSDSSSSLSIDKDWVAEHARQVWFDILNLILSFDRFLSLGSYKYSA